jgi:hypothetical protein
MSALGDCENTQAPTLEQVEPVNSGTRPASSNSLAAFPGAISRTYGTVTCRFSTTMLDAMSLKSGSAGVLAVSTFVAPWKPACW